jgi:hypothetical protein
MLHPDKFRLRADAMYDKVSTISLLQYNVCPYFYGIPDGKHKKVTYI